MTSLGRILQLFTITFVVRFPMLLLTVFIAIGRDKTTVA
jgi:hypothetical protein